MLATEPTLEELRTELIELERLHDFAHNALAMLEIMRGEFWHALRHRVPGVITDPDFVSVFQKRKPKN